tara:strand:- start:7314 stop:7766 length:453 start_codon:yes stop_codon:yes gene_type:complete
VGISTFSGPIKAGDVFNTTGTTVGTLRNVGFVAMAQTASITQAGTATALATGIVIPAYSHILNIQFLTSVAFTGADLTISIGTSATSTELVSALSLSAIGFVAGTPGTDATRTLLWSNVGASDVIIYAKSVNTGSGVTDLVVRYLQAENL